MHRTERRGGLTVNKLKHLNNLEDIKLTKEFIFLNPYRFIAYFIYGIIALIIGVCILLSFTSKQETIDVNGSLQLSDKVQDIQIYVDGVIDEVFVQDGDYVEKGETILAIQSSKLDVQKEDLENKLEEARNQQVYLTQLEECISNQYNTFQNNGQEAYYYAQVENYLTQIRSLNASVSNSTLNSLNEQKTYLQQLLNAMEKGESLSDTHVHRTQLRLYQKQLTSYDDQIKQAQEALDNARNPQMNPIQDPTVIAQYKQQLDTFKAEKENYADQQQLSVQQQLDTLNQQITQARNTANDTEQKTKTEIDHLTSSALVEAKNQEKQLQTTIKEYEASLASIDSDLSHYSVQASESGYIRYKGDIKKDTALSSGSIVGILTQEQNQTENFQVTLNVPSSGIGFVKNGQNVKLSVNGLDTREYGYINGNIQKIYETPVQVENTVYYLVETSVQIQENDGIYNDLFALKDDMTVRANIVTKETSWMIYILQKVNILKDTDQDITSTS